LAPFAILVEAAEILLETIFPGSPQTLLLQKQVHPSMKGLRGTDPEAVPLKISGDLIVAALPSA
jgi:hypothetical protein